MSIYSQQWVIEAHDEAIKLDRIHNALNRLYLSPHATLTTQSEVRMIRSLLKELGL